MTILWQKPPAIQQFWLSSAGSGAANSNICNRLDGRVANCVNRGLPAEPVIE